MDYKPRKTECSRRRNGRPCGRPRRENQRTCSECHAEDARLAREKLKADLRELEAWRGLGAELGLEVQVS